MVRVLRLCAPLLLLLTASCAAQQEDHLARRWLLLHTNPLVGDNVEQALSILDRAPGDFYDRAWLEKAKDVPGILGAMYTPRSTGYDNIEAWAQAVWGGQPR